MLVVSAGCGRRRLICSEGDDPALGVLGVLENHLHTRLHCPLVGKEGSEAPELRAVVEFALYPNIIYGKVELGC
jgi:hypothetical protein